MQNPLDFFKLKEENERQERELTQRKDKSHWSHLSLENLSILTLKNNSMTFSYW